MLKLYKNQKQTLYKIQKDLKTSKDRLYKYARKERSVDNMSVLLLLDLADYFEMKPDVLLKEMRNYLK